MQLTISSNWKFPSPDIQIDSETALPNPQPNEDPQLHSSPRVQAPPDYLPGGTVEHLCKAGQTEFAVYRHRPHEFSDFLKTFQISDSIQQMYSTLSPTPLSALIGGRGLSDFRAQV